MWVEGIKKAIGYANIYEYYELKVNNLYHNCFRII